MIFQNSTLKVWVELINVRIYFLILTKIFINMDCILSYKMRFDDIIIHHSLSKLSTTSHIHLHTIYSQSFMSYLFDIVQPLVIWVWWYIKHRIRYLKHCTHFHFFLIFSLSLWHRIYFGINFKITQDYNENERKNERIS